MDDHHNRDLNLKGAYELQSLKARGLRVGFPATSGRSAGLLPESTSAASSNATYT